MPNSIPKRYYDIQSPVLCGDKKDHLLQPYHASMQAEVAACKVAFPNSLLLVTSKSPKPYKQAVESHSLVLQAGNALRLSAICGNGIRQEPVLGS